MATNTLKEDCSELNIFKKLAALSSVNKATVMLNCFVRWVLLHLTLVAACLGAYMMVVSCPALLAAMLCGSTHRIALLAVTNQSACLLLSAQSF